MTLNITPEEQQVLIDSMKDRINNLRIMYEAYRDCGDKEAQMDCINEKRRVHKVLAKIATV